MVLAALVLGIGCAVALAQVDGTPPADGQSTPLGETTAETPSADDGLGGETTDTGTVPVEPGAEVERQFEAPAPSSLTEEQQEREVARACDRSLQLPVSDMRSSRQGTAAADDGSVLILLAGVALALLGFGYVVRRVRGPLTPRDKSPLELLSMVVALLVGLAGLGIQFIPGLGVRDRPAPEATMDVRQVHARVQYASFVRAVDDARRPQTPYDRRELGNVVWVELRLEGYRGKDLVLDWAEYNIDSGGALLPDTEGRRRLDVEHDVEARFEPVWVSYPRRGRFQVQFRLLDEGGQVRAMARTGPMRGTEQRYACDG
ncbi:MAG TPA: hypothetical protein VHF89_04755 [Solirubrobacteraceae bacterium]|nr:hypothetical protein [Solirubrobacteraceae bacterium]